MAQHVLQTLGGLGLFLLAMMVLTEGLRSIAGQALHDWLNVFTRSPLSGALTGTVVTGLLQSSSATIVATVGFVAADLLTFPQALGVVLGANLGTTATGWLVALFGFKLQLEVAAMPVVLGGMLLHLFGRNWLAEAGRAVAGFSLILIGIGMMQAGMAGFEDSVAPTVFPADTFGGRLLLVGTGLLVTTVTQSSSAGVAMAMAALSVGTIDFPQAAAMVIGMNIGTTVTPLISAIGSSRAAKRTAYSHTVYNLFTAVVGLLILSPYAGFLAGVAPELVNGGPAFALAGFHTLINFVALLFGLPLARSFARLMNRLVQEHDSGLARRLDPRLLAQPNAALAALQATLREEFDYLLRLTVQRLRGSSLPSDRPAAKVNRDLQATRDFLDAMNLSSKAAGGDGEQLQDRQPVVTAIHALDHLRRMFMRLQQGDRTYTLRHEPGFAESVAELLSLCGRLSLALQRGIDEPLYRECAQFAHRLYADAEHARDRTIALAVARQISVAESGRWLAARRWLEHMAHHLWRVSAHLGGFDVEPGAANPGAATLPPSTP